ncbi:unnamed protein product [Clonostachys byssicola]|uniref:RelA/SpoT domain-containing protein n=1 Tax=Clonostachys byssicola TaxID=160290 RepID=A0A9N9UN33_9HYPO|nr:unnamed protein product [Clonostachys byssicola]
MASRLTTLHSLHREVQAAIHDASIHLPANGSSSLKTNFCSETWPSLKPKYEDFVDGVVRYLKEELQTRNLNCMVIGRAKTAESVQQSLDRREKHRQRPCIGLGDILETIHDLAGSMVILQRRSDVQKVNQFIAQSFHAIQQPTHWSRDRQPGVHWESLFGSYESNNHHVTLYGDSNYLAGGPGVIFEIQVTTCGDQMYNLLAHDWYYKKAHGPLSRKDEIVLDMIHAAAIMVEVGAEYMKEREEENRNEARPEYDVLHIIQLAQGAEEWRFKPTNLPPILRALKKEGYNSATKLEHFAKNLRPLKEEDASSHDLVAQLLEIISQKSKRHFLVPFGQNERFVGREETINWLLERIPPGTRPNDCQRTAIEGLGGTGKTQIALEAAYRVRNTHSDCSVFWVPVLSITSFENAYREIGDALKVPGLQDKKADIKMLVKSALNNESSGEWLLILDNLDDIELVAGLVGFLPSSPKGSILFTTRNHIVATSLDIAPGHVERVGEMSRDEALEMLKRYTEESQRKDIADTSKLLDFLADLPLAIRQASAYMWKHDITTTKYLSYCQSSDGRTITMLSKDFEDRSRYKHTRNPVATTWLISFTHLSRDKPLAARYLRSICFLAEKDIPESLLPFEEDEIERDKATAALKAYAFITKRENAAAFDIHRLVRLAMRNHLRREERIEAITSVVQHLSKIYPFPWHENRSIWTRYMPHTLTVAAVCEESTDEHATGILLRCVAATYEITATYEKAEEVYRRVLQRYEEIIGREHPLVLVIMNNLAIVLERRRKYGEAKQMHQHVLESRQKVLGKDHPDTLSSMNNLAKVLFGQGNYSEVKIIYQQVLDLRTKVLGKDHPDTLISINNLAATLVRQGNYSVAEQMHQQALDLRTKVLGKDHPDTLISMNNLADTLVRQGNYSVAEQMHQQVLDLRIKVLGKDYPDTLISMNNLAKVLGGQGKYSEAEQMHQQALELREKALGREHPYTLDGMESLALVIMRQGRYSEANQIYRQALELYIKVLGRDHPDTVSCHSAFQACLKEIRKKGRLGDLT